MPAGCDRIEGMRLHFMNQMRSTTAAAKRRQHRKRRKVTHEETAKWFHARLCCPWRIVDIVATERHARVRITACAGI